MPIWIFPIQSLSLYKESGRMGTASFFRFFRPYFSENRSEKNFFTSDIFSFSSDLFLSTPYIDE